MTKARTLPCELHTAAKPCTPAANQKVVLTIVKANPATSLTYNLGALTLCHLAQSVFICWWARSQQTAYIHYLSIGCCGA